MRHPFDGTPLQTQGFNDPRYRADYYQFDLLGHNGLDFALNDWTPILAPHKGICREVRDEGDKGYGKYIKVESGEEGSVLAHLAKFSVAEGQQVEEGQIIGYSGNSGNSTGPHLHWGYYKTRTRNRTNGFNGYIDQTDWLDHTCQVVITDQTIINLDPYGNHEIQALKGKMGDLARLTTLVEDKDKKIAELTQELAREKAEKPFTQPVITFSHPLANFFYALAKGIDKKMD